MNGAKAAAATPAILRRASRGRRTDARRRAVADLVVAQQHAERLAAGVPELLLVDLAEELALVELQGPRLVLRPVRAQETFRTRTLIVLVASGSLLDQVVQARARRPPASGSAGDGGSR